MPQLHLYVSEEVASIVKRKAKSRKVSLSKYLAELVHRDIETAWPVGYLEEVVGGWKGKPLKRVGQGEFEHRDAT